MADAADATNGRHLTTLRLFADLPESDGSDEWDDESVVVGLRDEDDDSRYGRLACFGANDVTRSLGHLLWDDDARLPVISFAERNGTFAQALYLRRGSWDGITVTSTGEPFDAEHARVVAASFAIFNRAWSGNASLVTVSDKRLLSIAVKLASVPPVPADQVVSNVPIDELPTSLVTAARGDSDGPILVFHQCPWPDDGSESPDTVLERFFASANESLKAGDLVAVGVMINTRNFASYGFISEAASAEDKVRHIVAPDGFAFLGPDAAAMTDILAQGYFHASKRTALHQRLIPYHATFIFQKQ